jgi:hypothetical protein
VALILIVLFPPSHLPVRVACAADVCHFTYRQDRLQQIPILLHRCAVNLGDTFRRCACEFTAKTKAVAKRLSKRIGSRDKFLCCLIFMSCAGLLSIRYCVSFIHFISSIVLCLPMCHLKTYYDGWLEPVPFHSPLTDRKQEQETSLVAHGSTTWTVAYNRLSIGLLALSPVIA